MKKLRIQRRFHLFMLMPTGFSVMVKYTLKIVQRMEFHCTDNANYK